MMTTLSRKHTITQAFKDHFGHEPDIWVRAPGRVDLMGSHTDYNLGYVLTMTIDRDTWIAAAPRDDAQVEIYSMNIKGGSSFSLTSIEHDTVTPWTNYIRGVAVALQKAGYALHGFDGLIHSTIPFGSGLSSSAAIEMATAETFQAVGGFSLDPVEKALLGQQAENHFVGVNSGILDQYSSSLGRAGSALLLDCRDNSNRIMPIMDDISIVICDTKAERNLTGTEYDDRRNQCEEGVQRLQTWYPDIEALRDVSLQQFEAHEADLPDVVARRCRFIIEENQRVLDLADTLPTGNRDKLAGLLADSYHGARDLFEIGAPAMEAMMQAMLDAPGVIGARQAGAGFGGCMVALVEKDQVDDFQASVLDTYKEAMGIDTSVYEVIPSDGAGPLQFEV